MKQKRNGVFDLKTVRLGVMLSIFLVYLVNISMFQHTHIIHGTTIVHSHIHTANHHRSANGNHTQSQLTLIAQLSQYQAEHPSILSDVPDPLPEYQTKIRCVFQSNHPICRLTGTQSLRAPPII